MASWDDVREIVADLPEAVEAWLEAAPTRIAASFLAEHGMADGIDDVSRIPAGDEA